MNNLKEQCMFGEKCYRILPLHFKEYSHAHLDLLVSVMKDDNLEIPSFYNPQVSKETLIQQVKLLKQISKASNSDRSTTSSEISQPFKTSARKRKNSEDECNSGSLNLNEKLLASEPYRFFMSVIPASRQTQTEKLSLSFVDLLSKELGCMTGSLQINYMIEYGWLLAQYYYSRNRGVPLTLLHGVEDEELNRAIELKKTPHVVSKLVKPPSPFGHHHTKMMIHSYKDGTIRVIVTTGNLVESDWLNRCQGIWVSPALPSITNSEKYDDLVYDSPTRFKRDLLLYLEFYKLDILKSWVQLVKKSDFSQINTFFVASVPGSHEQNSAGLWGLGKVEKVLKNYLEVPSTETNDRHSLIYQCSSIGSLGSTIDWFIGELTSKLSSSKSKSNREKCDVDLVYPTTKNVISSYGGVESGCCLPYSRSTHKNQTWLGSYFKQWKSDARYRTRAVPHIKTYCRLNSRKTNLLWFLLTSANCSKAAWGKTTSKGKVQILSYEAGVMFLPKFTINKESMPVGYTADATGVLPFPMPYDVPLVPYEANDTPWFIESVFR